MDYRRPLHDVAIMIVMLTLLLTGCASNRGRIEGTIVGADTGEPLENTQIILCLQSEQEESLCILQAAPTTVSDSNGTFRLSRVSAGSYLLMYGMPDELASTSDEWGGVEVGPTTLTLNGLGRFVPTGEGMFWEDGWETVGNEYTSESTPSFSILGDGYIRSNRLGISMMVENMDRAPVIEVCAGETTQIEWQVMAR